MSCSTLPPATSTYDPLTSAASLPFAWLHWKPVSWCHCSSQAMLPRTWLPVGCCACIVHPVHLGIFTFARVCSRHSLPDRRIKRYLLRLLQDVLSSVLFLSFSLSQARGSKGRASERQRPPGTSELAPKLQALSESANSKHMSQSVDRERGCWVTQDPVAGEEGKAAGPRVAA